jgi:hypothetical protein
VDILNPSEQVKQVPATGSARRVSAANVKREPARAGLRLEHGVGAAARKEKPISRLQLELSLLDEKSRSALEYEHPLVVGLLEGDWLGQGPAEDLLDGEGWQLDERSDPFALVGGARGWLEAAAEKPALHYPEPIRWRRL